MHEEATQLAARLIATGFLPREDKAVVRALTDQLFRDEVDRRLAACGMVLLDNPYAAHIAVALASSTEKDVFSTEDRRLSNTLGLSKPEITLLVVLWALLIIPKRERQLTRTDPSGQAALLPANTKIDRASHEMIPLRTFLEDFKHLGAITYIRRCLGILARHRFIVIERENIFEGPRLDLIMDYAKMAPRIKDGILADYRRISEARRELPSSTAASLTEGDLEQEDDDVQSEES